MSKFGELIDSELPILLDFYTDWNESSTSMHPVLKDVAAAIGDKGKVIKINVDKNNELAQALRMVTMQVMVFLLILMALKRIIQEYSFLNLLAQS